MTSNPPDSPVRRLARLAKRSLHAGAGAELLAHLVTRRPPRSANVEVTTACNLACPLCPTHLVERSTRHLPLEQVDALLARGGRTLRSVCLHVQGEPTMHPDLYAIVRRFRAADVEVWFGTNGMLLEQQLDELLDSDLDGLSVSLDGVDGEDYDRYRKGGDFDRVVRGVRALLEERHARGRTRPAVHLQMVMFTYNEARMDEARAFLESFGADEVTLKPPAYDLDLEEGRRRGLELEPGRAERVSAAADAFLDQVEPDDPGAVFSRRRDEAVLYRDRPLCPQLERATVLSDGRVVACCMDAQGTTTFGSLADEPFSRIWRGAAHRRVIRAFRAGELRVCSTCTLS